MVIVKDIMKMIHLNFKFVQKEMMGMLNDALDWLINWSLSYNTGNYISYACHNMLNTFCPFSRSNMVFVYVNIII